MNATVGAWRDQRAAFADVDGAARTHRGHGLRMLRVSRGLSGLQLAEAAGVPAHTVYNWERGGARVPQNRIPSLAAALGLRADDLVAALASAPAQTPRPRSRPLRALARIRVAAGYSQVAAATHLGFSRSSLRAYENGKRAPLAHIRRMAALYETSVAEVATASGVIPPRELNPRTWRSGDLPRVLRVLREWSGLTQRELALRVGASRDSVRAWENARTQPGPMLRTRLEEFYRLPPDGLRPAYGQETLEVSLAGQG